MNRSRYFNYIEEKLSVLAYRINIKGKLNILDLHMHSEDFYLHFLNKLYCWELINMNKKLQNVEAIDLIDDNNKIIIQVSATSTKSKIESALKKNIMQSLTGYTFKFVSISNDSSKLRKLVYENSSGIKFEPANDIMDPSSILDEIKSKEIPFQRIIYSFIKDELGAEIDIIKLDSNLATIINILSEEDLNKFDTDLKLNSFEIDRKIEFNNLDICKIIIEDYKVHYNRVNKKYEEFDKLGKNKSNSVLASIRGEYIKNIKMDNDDELFFKVIDNVLNLVTQSANYISIPSDELDQCINILVVDAFIRCKIFKNPENYNYVTS
ncbi:MAG: SMEK domain-containing protein [Ignavibacteriae bacterium]|nr:SMEK domain-containing protein [Ignavibacteriota bacterium]